MEPQIHSSDLRRYNHAQIQESPVGSPAAGLRDPGSLFLKRVMDVLVAAFLLILTLPCGVAIALAIVLDTRGPVFFGHSRIGKGNSRFRLLKFRSMMTNSDAVLARHLEAHPDKRTEWLERQKLKRDPRVTRVGRVLRRFSLDELPQLINVLRGEMSMVGPRPIVEQEIPKFGNVFPLYTQVSPGLTGLWQVSDRSRTSYRRRIDLDLEYIRNRTLGMDLLVLLKTIQAVLFGRGAY